MPGGFIFSPEKFRSAIAANGLSAYTLSYAAAVPQPSIWAYQNGKHNPSATTLVKLARALGVAPVVGARPGEHVPGVEVVVVEARRERRVGEAGRPSLDLRPEGGDLRRVASGRQRLLVPCERRGRLGIAGTSYSRRANTAASCTDRCGRLPIPVAAPGCRVSPSGGTA